MLIFQSGAKYALQVFESGLIWCPNAKVGSSSVITALGLGRDYDGVRPEDMQGDDEDRDKYFEAHAGTLEGENSTWKRAQAPPASHRRPHRAHRPLAAAAHSPATCTPPP